MLIVRGFSLVELAISMLITSTLVLFASTGAVALTHTLSQLRLQISLISELRLLSQTVAIQLSRAGYIKLPFEQIVVDPSLLPPEPSISHHPLSPANSCILFAYDKNQDGTITAHSPSEWLGFRLHNGALEYRVAQRLCDQGGWYDLNDSKKFRVTTFNIVPIGKADHAQVYEIHITLETLTSTRLEAEKTLLIRVPNVR